MVKPTFWQYITIYNPITLPCAVFILALAVLALIFNDGYQASFTFSYCMFALEIFFWAMMVRAYRKL